MSFISDALERLRTLIFRSHEERDFADELATHVAMETDFRHRAGTPEAEARRQSLAALGGIERVKEDARDARGTRFIDDALGDIVLTLRSLRRNPGFTLVVILTLALGIGGTTAVFSAVDAVLLQPLPLSQPGQLVRIYQNGVTQPDAKGFVTPVHYLAFRNQLATFEGVAAILTYDHVGADIGTGNDVRRIRILPTSANYFDVMRVHPVIGHSYPVSDEEGPNIEDDITDAGLSVVLSHDLWRTQFHGDSAIIGQPLVMSGKAYTVLGVMPAGYVDPIAGPVDAWLPVNLSQGKDASEAGNHYLTLIGRVRSGVTLERAQSELGTLATHLAQQYPQASDSRARLYPLKDEVVGSSSKSLLIMLGAVALVLVLVCVNIANLMLVRGSERTREFAIRAVLGARSGRLVRQLLIESLTLALAGAIAGLVVARLAMAAIVTLGAGNIPRLASLSLNPALLAFSFAVGTLSALLFGLAPALRAARAEASEALRDQSRSTTSGAGTLRGRDWLVISQVALAFVLLVGAGLLLASFRAIGEVDLGVRPAHVLTFELNLPAARYDSTARGIFYDAFAVDVAALPGVRAAGAISRLPATGSYHSWGVVAQSGPLAGDTKRNQVGAENRVIAGDYFAAAGIPLVAGRLFDARDGQGTPDRVIISHSVADRLFPRVDPIGQRLRTGGRESEVIGVVGNVSVDNEGAQALYVYHPHRQFAGDRNWALTQVVRTTGSPMAIEPAVRRLLAVRDPQLVMYRPMPLEDAIGAGAAQRLFTLRILGTFAGVALALSALGLFGVLSYGVKLRSREFGIRMALGADRGAIGGMVLRHGMAVTAVGIAIGLVGATVFARVMRAVLFHVSPLDPTVLGGAVCFMALVAGLAALLPARRATTVDPREVLQ
ncbi:MAG TPA: ABC transporter permease [Gemmatimonadales bacterium]|jgi:predicted permease|nr:ABC transporter permease [Gemmatimonadales bacterium]